MSALRTTVDPAAPDFVRKREAMLELIGQLDEVLEEVRAGGGERGGQPGGTRPDD